MIKNKKIRNCIFLGVVLVICLQIVSALPFYYNVSLHYNSGDLEVKSINVIKSDYNLLRSSGDYLVKVVDKNNEIMSKNLFQIPLIEIKEDYSRINSNNFSDNKSLGEVRNLNDVYFEVFVPYRDGEMLIISDNLHNKELKLVKISDFLNIEKKQDNKKDINIINDPLNNNLVNNSSTYNNVTFKIIVILVLIVLILIIIYLIWKKFLKMK